MLTIQGGYRKYKEVSFLRGFAITTVVLMHLIQLYWNRGEIPNWLRMASSLGGTGGHIFILSSGFGLYLSYLHRPISFGEFLKKRFIKIYIPYLLFILIHYFFLPHWGSDDILRRKMLFSHIFLYKMFFEQYMCSFGLQLWFVSAIIQLYILFLPLCKLREKTSLRVLLATGLSASVIWWCVMYASGLGEFRIWGSFCLQYLWEFVLGMGAAEVLYHRDSTKLPLWGMLLGCIGGLGLQAVMAMRGGWIAIFNDVPGLIGYASMVLLLYCCGKHVLRPIFAWVDTISYEWFLIHVDTIMWAYYFGRQHTDNELLLAVGAIAFSLTLAWIFSWVVRAIMKIFRTERIS